MEDEPKLPKPSQLLRDLKEKEELRHEAIGSSELNPRLALLRRWQSERLTDTYADLLKDKTTRPACLFFLSDIYAPRDFSQRNHDITRIYAILKRVVPASMLQLFVDVIELNELTDQLDAHLIEVLTDQLGVVDNITPELYAEGYRRCDNYAERVRQIDLIHKVGLEVGIGARLPVINLGLKMLKAPAHSAGWVELYDFLVRGYGAFKQLRDAKAFMNTIRQREMHILNRIYASQPNPFDG